MSYVVKESHQSSVGTETVKHLWEHSHQSSPGTDTALKYIHVGKISVNIKTSALNAFKSCSPNDTFPLTQ